jgi:hypothetical protein
LTFGFLGFFSGSAFAFVTLIVVPGMTALSGTGSSRPPDGPTWNAQRARSTSTAQTAQRDGRQSRWKGDFAHEPLSKPVEPHLAV